MPASRNAAPRLKACSCMFDISAIHGSLLERQSAHRLDYCVLVSGTLL